MWAAMLAKATAAGRAGSIPGEPNVLEEAAVVEKSSTYLQAQAALKKREAKAAALAKRAAEAAAAAAAEEAKAAAAAAAQLEMSLSPASPPSQPTGAGAVGGGGTHADLARGREGSLPAEEAAGSPVVLSPMTDVASPAGVNSRPSPEPLAPLASDTSAATEAETGGAAGPEAAEEERQTMKVRPRSPHATGSTPADQGAKLW